MLCVRLNTNAVMAQCLQMFTKAILGSETLHCLWLSNVNISLEHCLQMKLKSPQ